MMVCFTAGTHLLWRWSSRKLPWAHAVFWQKERWGPMRVLPRVTFGSL